MQGVVKEIKRQCHPLWQPSSACSLTFLPAGSHYYQRNQEVNPAVESGPHLRQPLLTGDLETDESPSYPKVETLQFHNTLRESKAYDILLAGDTAHAEIHLPVLITSFVSPHLPPLYSLYKHENHRWASKILTLLYLLLLLCCDKMPWPRQLIEEKKVYLGLWSHCGRVHNSRDGQAGSSRHGCRNRKLSAHIINHQFDICPSASLHFLDLLKQCHKLGTKCSNAQDWGGGISYFNHYPLPEDHISIR